MWGSAFSTNMGDGTIQSAVFLDLRLLLCLLITFLLKISTSFQYFIQKVVILLVKCYDKGRLKGHGFYCNDKGQLEEIRSVFMIHMDSRLLRIQSLYFHCLETAIKLEENSSKQREATCEFFFLLPLLFFGYSSYIMIYELFWYIKAWKK